MLLKNDLRDIIELSGLNESGNEVVAQVKMGVDVKELLKNKPNFTRNIFPNGWSHKGAQWSVRSIGSPSLQITGWEDGHLEIDIDRWCPRWIHPIATAKHLGEIGLNQVTRWFKHPTCTSQRDVAKALNKQKYPVLVARQARVLYFI